MGSVVHPSAGGRDPLAGRYDCGMTDDGHDVPKTTRLDAQNAEAVFRVVVSDALDESRQNFVV